MPKKRRNRKSDGRFKSRTRADAAYRRWENPIQTILRIVWWTLLDVLGWVWRIVTAPVQWLWRR